MHQNNKLYNNYVHRLEKFIKHEIKIKIKLEIRNVSIGNVFWKKIVSATNSSLESREIDKIGILKSKRVSHQN